MTDATYPSLRDRGVLITGGSTGIGASLVEHFARAGSRVGFCDIDVTNGERLAASLADVVHAPVFVPADLADAAAIPAMVAAVRQRCGPVSILLNNAANDMRHSIEATTPASWDAGVAVNLKHQFFVAQAVIEDMKGLGGGSIVNFGSVSWKLKQGGMPVYTMSKAAVEGLTRSLARDLGPFNIRVNTLVPGWVMTERQLKLWFDDKGREEVKRGQCIDKPLMPAHIAHMALFLAADDSAMCTAQNFVVDGGWT